MPVKRFKISKDIEIFAYCLFAKCYDQSSFNQVFKSNTPCRCVYRPDFAFFCVSHRSLVGGGRGGAGGGVGDYTVELSGPDMI
jgi:hypothetical protein